MPEPPRGPSTPATGRQRPRGRPRLAADQLRTAALPCVRLSAPELAQVKAMAEAHRLSVSEYVRRIVLGRRLPEAIPRVNLEVWAKLGPLAGNLNQYMKAINQGRAAGAPLPLLLDIRQVLDLLREELRGHTDDHGAAPL